MARLGLFRWETTLLEAMSLIPSPLNLAPVHASLVERLGSPDLSL